VHQDAQTLSTTGLRPNCVRLTCLPVIGSRPRSDGAPPLAWLTAPATASADPPFRFCAMANPPTTATTSATVVATYARRRSVNHHRRDGATRCALRARFALRPLTDSSGGDRGSESNRSRDLGREGQGTGKPRQTTNKPPNPAYQLGCGDQVCGCAVGSRIPSRGGAALRHPP